MKVYIIIYAEAIDAEMLVAGTYLSRESADLAHQDLLKDASDDWWEIVERDVEQPLIDQLQAECERLREENDRLWNAITKVEINPNQ